MINREELVRKFNPKFNSIDLTSPVLLGNGDFAFTVDVTGLQTLKAAYGDTFPLHTYSNRAWESNTFYSLDDLEETEYEYKGRKVHYPVKETETNSLVYNCLRQNPTRYDEASLGFLLGGLEICPLEITEINEELDLYTGIVTSSFKLCGVNVTVDTLVGNDSVIGVRVKSPLLKERLTVSLTVDDRLKFDVVGDVKFKDGIISSLNGETLEFALNLWPDKDGLTHIGFLKAKEESELRYYTLWNKGAMIDVSGSEDARGLELERRIITSMYLVFAGDAGSLPPQETGLLVKSWYGKFHLEMHPLHTAFLALYGRGELLEKSLGWYVKILPKAIGNASKNGFKGARWPKMTDPSGNDSPSVIAPLLIWQQPHVLYMLNLLRLSRYRDDRVEVAGESETEFLKRYSEIVTKTAEFMADFAVYNESKEQYELLPPLYSVQEKGDPLKIKNPPFECAYWAFGLKIAYEWMDALSEKHPEWLKIADNMAGPYVACGKYQAYEGFDDTYTKLNMDHPSFLFQYGWLPLQPDREILAASFDELGRTWDFHSLWGWDFALLSMVNAKHGDMNEAFEWLLKASPKNEYTKMGYNRQAERKDLPLYMPGNGSLLMACTLLKSTEKFLVKTEGIMHYPL